MAIIRSIGPRHGYWAGLLLCLSFSVLAADKPAEKPTDKPADWPQFRGPNRNGTTSYPGLLTQFSANGPAKLWTANVGPGYASLAIANGKAYTSGNTKDVDNVYCYNADTGQEIWHIKYATHSESWNSITKNQVRLYPGSRATPTVDGQMVYILSLDAQLRCLDAQKGTEIWKKDLIDLYKPKETEYRYGYASAPLICDKLLIQHLNCQTVALDKLTGNEVWRWQDRPADTDAGGYSAPVLFNNEGKPAIAVLTKSLVAMSLDKGEELWRVNHFQPYDHGLNAADPIFKGNEVFISQGNYTRDCGMWRFGGGKATQVWRNSDTKASMLVHFQTPVLYQDHLFGFHENVLRCVEFQTGSVKWSEKGLVTKYGAPILIDDKLVILTDKGEVLIVAAATDACKILTRGQVLPVPKKDDEACWSPPSFAQGKLYCRNNRGAVVCIDLRKR